MNMNHRTTPLVLGIIALLITVAVPATAVGKQIALFAPRQDAFWKKVAFFAQDAAADLNVSLRVYYSDNNPDQMVAQVQSAIKDSTDGILFPAYQNSGERILRLAEESRIPAIMISSGLLYADHRPRMKFKYWIASVHPDDQKVGALLIQKLVQDARLRVTRQVNILAVEGNPRDESSVFRVRGLNEYLRHETDLAAVKVVTGNWDRETASAQFITHYRKHQDIDIVWCASDHMALGVIDAIRVLGIQNKVIVGGIDWDPGVVAEIRQDSMQVSIGGHFLDGAWATVLMVDYLHGFDFGNEALRFESPMVGIDRNNLATFQPLLAVDPQSIDFSRYSKIYNPALKLYRFDLQSIAERLVPESADAALSKQGIASMSPSWAFCNTSAQVNPRTGTIFRSLRLLSRRT